MVGQGHQSNALDNSCYRLRISDEALAIYVDSDVPYKGTSVEANSPLCWLIRDHSSYVKRSV